MSAEENVQQPEAMDVVKTVPVAAEEVMTLDKKTPEEIAAVSNDILERVEFYFHDANLPFDKFLFTLTVQDPEGLGWVSLETIASFKRMRDYLPLGLDFIANVLRKSENLLEVSEDGKKVRRKTPLAKTVDAFGRSAYVKGFPAESDTLQKELETYFHQFGKINAVRMRREDGEKGAKGGKKFKGSVFVEFRDMEDLEKFLALEQKPTFEGQDGELLCMSKEAYCNMKMVEKGIDPKTSKTSRGAGSSSTSHSIGSNGRSFNAFREMALAEKGLSAIIPGKGGNIGKESLKRKRETDEEEGERKKKAVDAITFPFHGCKLRCTIDGTVANPDDLVPPAGRVLRFSEAQVDGDWQQLKKDIVEAGFESPFVVFPRGSSVGAFEHTASLTPEEIEKIKAANIAIGGQQLKWEILTGEDLHKHYLARANFQAKKAVEAVFAEEAPKEKGKGGGRGGRGGGRGGRGGRGGGRGGRGGGKRNDRNAEKAAAEAAPKVEKTGDAYGVVGSGVRGATVPQLKTV